MTLTPLSLLSADAISVLISLVLYWIGVVVSAEPPSGVNEIVKVPASAVNVTFCSSWPDTR